LRWPGAADGPDESRYELIFLLVKSWPGGQISPARWQLGDEALRSWANAQGIDPKQLSLTPVDLGVLGDDHKNVRIAGLTGRHPSARRFARLAAGHGGR
jgi:hypothetical protein